ncbi:hypothetical protein [Rathayibacter sp. VKM Ac-2835]|nr:hypothetical protein [Rathayibacter sp. VKM Ac-2835]
MTPLHELNDALWWSTSAVNVSGTFALGVAVLIPSSGSGGSVRSW